MNEFELAVAAKEQALATAKAAAKAAAAELRAAKRAASPLKERKAAKPRPLCPHCGQKMPGAARLPKGEVDRHLKAFFAVNPSAPLKTIYDAFAAAAPAIKRLTVLGALNRGIKAKTVLKNANKEYSLAPTAPAPAVLGV
jgi:hypothetical protein